VEADRERVHTDLCAAAWAAPRAAKPTNPVSARCGERASGCTAWSLLLLRGRGSVGGKSGRCRPWY